MGGADGHVPSPSRSRGCGTANKCHLDLTEYRWGSAHPVSEGKVRKDKRYVEIYTDVIYYREKVTVVNKLNKRKTGTRNVQYKASAS